MIFPFLAIPNANYDVKGKAGDNSIAERALLRLVELRREALASGTRHAALIFKTSDGYRESARNLIHYLSIRSSDIRELQTDLARLGLSSLGRMEAHVLSTMDQVIDLLHMLTGQPNRPIPYQSNIDLDKGKQLIENHALALLGEPAAEHDTRIMVTVSKEAVDDANSIQDMLKRGMQIMRINCAHDAPVTWARMMAPLQ